MKNDTHVSRLVLGALTLLTLAPIAQAWGCEAKLSVNGEAFGEHKRSHSSSNSIELSGILTAAEMSVFPAPTAFTVDLRGKRNFRFRFSDNITKIRLTLGSDLIYDGAPTSTFAVTSKDKWGKLKIEPQWAGDTFSIAVADDCSISSVLSSLFR
jgi:hypothetical protein